MVSFKNRTYQRTEDYFQVSCAASNGQDLLRLSTTQQQDSDVRTATVLEHQPKIVEWLIEHAVAIPSEEELHDSGVQDAEVLRLKEKARHSLTGNAGADRSHRNTCAVFPSVIDSLSDTRVMCTNWTRTCPQT